jgi:predicted DNA-binding transcriptional regulator AlpA
MTHDRIALRPAQAAAFLGCSQASLYRWASTRPDFPQPTKIPGIRATCWWSDELARWRDQNLTHAQKRKTLCDLAQRAADTSLFDRGSHPFVRAFLLAGGESLATLADETGLPEDALRELDGPDGNCDLDRDALTKLHATAVACVLHRERELRTRLDHNPELAESPTFQKMALDLDEAHRLTFGHSLMNVLRDMEGEPHGNA